MRSKVKVERQGQIQGHSEFERYCLFSLNLLSEHNECTEILLFPVTFIGQGHRI